MNLAVTVALVLSAVPPLFRLWRGPTLWDRLAGAASVNVRITVLLAVEGMRMGHSVLLDVAFAYAVLGFLGTVLVARFGERGER